MPVFIVFLLVLGGIWFWSLGALPDDAPGTATLSAVEGQVSVKAPGANDFVLAKQGDEVAEGASIRTGSDGKATVSWYGDAESRIGPDSEISVLTAQDDSEAGATLRLKLVSGRIWSRVMRLLDLDADMTVETDDVVATVRGTSFDMEKKPAQATTLWVADSVVEASGATVVGPQDGFFVAEGNMASFGGAKPTTSVRPLSDEDRGTDWFKNNTKADEDFRSGKVARLLASLGADRAPANGIFHDMAEGSLALRQKFGSETMRQKLATRLLVRRLAFVKRTIQEGKSGLGYQEFARIDGEFRSRVAANDAAAQAARPAALLAQVLFRDVLPGDPAYRVKQQVEEWLPLVARKPADPLFARLLVIDSRLDEAAAETRAQAFDQAGQMIILARQGLTNADREIRNAKGVDTQALNRLRHLWKALSVRADGLDAGLKQAIAPPPALPTILIEDARPTSTATGTAPLAPSSTPVVTPAPTSTPVAPTQTPTPVSLQVQPSQATVGFDGSVSFRAVVVYDTGLTKDVTKTSKFVGSPMGYGALNGSVFTASQLKGTVVFTATYAEGGKTLQGSTTVTIVDTKP